MMITDKIRKINSNTEALNAGPGCARLWVNADGELKLNVDGTITTVGSSGDPTFDSLKVGDLALSNDLDPIYGSPVNSLILIGVTSTKTDHNNFIDYLAVSVEPDANGGIYTGRETLMYTPDSNAHSVSQIYGDEIFYQGFSPRNIATVIGLHISAEQYAGNVTGGITNLLLNAENDAVGATINSTRNISVHGAQNYDDTSTLTLHEAIRITTGSNAGTVVNNYGLHILDQTLGGTVSGINRAIDVNNKFIVGPDGAGVIIIPTTTDPHRAGAVWNNAGTLTISAG